MCYLSIFLVWAVIGMLISIFLHAYFSTNNTERRENKYLVTKDDIAKITAELDELKNLYKKTSNEIVADQENEIIETPETEEILQAEKEFYDSIARNNEQNLH
jgi:hypothetical protein